MNPYNPNELSHSGIQKQKWGVRRWQNPDGTLTPAGRERYRKLAQKRRKLQSKMNELDPSNSEGKSKDDNAKEKQDDQSSRNKPRTIHDMDMAELKARTERMNAEKAYIDSVNNLNASKKALSNAQRSTKRIIADNVKKTLINDVAISVAASVGKAYLEKVLKNKLGLNSKKG